jgi:hypothetical protein
MRDYLAALEQQDGDAYARERQHVLEMNRGQRHFAGDQHQAAALLEDHVGRPVHQVIAVAMGDRRQGPHRAGMTTIPSVWNDPDDTAAPISLIA